MKTGIDVMTSRGLRTEGDVTSDDFAKAGLPMVVACTGCTMTMGLWSALVDGDDLCWCADCAEGME